MRPLAFSTNAFKKNTLEEAIDSIADAGYSGVELMADVPHALPAAMDSGRIDRVRQRIMSRGLCVTNINAFTLFACGDTYHPTWIEDEPADRKRRIDHTLGAIGLASAFGVKTVSLQPGGPMIGTHLTRNQAGERFAEGLSQCIPAARNAGVILAIEPEPGLFIQDSAEFIEFKQRYFANDDSVRMNCDAGHLFCVGDEPAAAIRRHAEHIAHVHLEDIGSNRVHQHLTPGRGAMDFASIFHALDDIHYAGHCTVELYPYETTAAGVARQAFEHLRRAT